MLYILGRFGRLAANRTDALAHVVNRTDALAHRYYMMTVCL